MKALIGRPAPDFDVALAGTGRARLADFRRRPLLLIFLRHLAWLPCQAHLVEVRDRLVDLERAAGGLDVLVVTFAPVERLSAWRERLGIPFALAADPAREAYRAYGLLHGSSWDVWHPRVLLRYAALLLKGMKIQRPGEDEDISQLGGDFLIDQAGVVRFAHPSRRPDDRPGVAQLLRALAKGPGS